MIDELKMMLDECIHNKRLRLAFDESESFDVLTSFDLGYKPKEPDENLVAGTAIHNRLLLTVDKRTITEKKFPPCNHGGILQFRKCEVTPDYVISRLQALFFLNLIDKAIGHFTYIYFDKIKIVTHTETIEKKFNDYKELRYIVGKN